jgi:hypothetical protein
MVNEAVPVPEAAALLARVDSRLAKTERMLAAALSAAARPGALYLGLLELAGEMRLERLGIEGMKILLAAERTSVLAEQAGADDAAREPCPVIRLSG